MLDAKYVRENIDFIKWMCSDFRHMKNISFIDEFVKNYDAHKALNQKLMKFNEMRNSGKNVKKYIRILKPKVEKFYNLFRERLMDIPNVPYGSDIRYMHKMLANHNKEMLEYYSRCKNNEMSYFSELEDFFIHDFIFWITDPDLEKDQKFRTEFRQGSLWDLEFQCEYVNHTDARIKFYESQI